MRRLLVALGFIPPHEPGTSIRIMSFQRPKIAIIASMFRRSKPIPGQATQGTV